MPPTPFLWLPGIFRYMGIGVDVIAACGAVTELSPIFAKQVLHSSSSTCLHFFPVGKFLHVSHISSGSWVLYRRCKKRNLCLRGRDSRQFSEATFLLILYCAVISLRIDLLCLDGTLANFFLRRFGSHLVLCGRFPSDRSSLPRQNSRQFFRSMFFSYCVLCGHFPSDRSSLPRQNSRHFFTQQTKMTWPFAMIFNPKMRHTDLILDSFWSHFEVILGSFWGLLDHFGASGVHLGSSLGQRGLQVTLNNVFPPLFWDPFLDLFSLCSHFDVKKCNSSDCKIQCLFPGRFLIDFLTILRSDLEVQNGLKCSKYCSNRILDFLKKKDAFECHLEVHFGGLLGSWIAHYTPLGRAGARYVRFRDLREFEVSPPPLGLRPQGTQCI